MPPKRQKKAKKEDTDSEEDSGMEIVPFSDDDSDFELPSPRARKSSTSSSSPSRRKTSSSKGTRSKQTGEDSTELDGNLDSSEHVGRDDEVMEDVDAGMDVESDNESDVFDADDLDEDGEEEEEDEDDEFMASPKSAAGKKGKKATASRGKSGKAASSGKSGKKAAKTAPAGKTGKRAPSSSTKGGKRGSSSSSSAPATIASAAANNEKGTVSEKDAEPLIIQNIVQTNRPWSVQQIIDNLRGAVKKTVVQKVLDRVAGKGLIAFKDTGGKQKVYWADQSQFPVLSEEERTTLQRSIESIEDDLLAKKADLSSLEHRIKDLQQEMTIEQMDAEIDVLEKEIARDKLSVAALQGGVNLVSDEERIQVENDLFKYSKIWRQRRAMVRDAMDTVCEGLGKRTSEFMEECGMEDDISYGYSWTEFSGSPLFKKIKK